MDKKAQLKELRDRNRELEAENARLRQMLEHVHINMRLNPHPKVIQQMIPQRKDSDDRPQGAA